MPDLSTPETESAFVCDCEEELRPACAGETYYEEYEGKRYCVLHFPGKDKSAEFRKALQRKQDNKDFDFRGVIFPDKVSFHGVDFSDVANFSYAIFSGDADFRTVTFREWVSFRFATFNGEVDFWFATSTLLADFGYATFRKEADFSSATFHVGADFEFATFADYVTFNSAPERFKQTVFPDTSSLSLAFARIEKADRVSFHTVTLRPHWFVNVDASKFDFTNVDWKWRSTNQELKSVRNHLQSPHRMLAIACRHLAVNSEEHHRYEEASKFRYMAMDARRRESLLGFAPWNLSWWYWLASGYGERIFRAFVVLIAILASFALVYSRVNCVRVPFFTNVACLGWEQKQPTADQIGSHNGTEPAWTFPRGLAYSANVMALQKPEPRPATTAAQTVVLLETILGPVQAALLALAIRRKFMR